MKSIFSVLLLLSTAFTVYGLPDEWQEISVRLDESVWADSSLSELMGGKEITYSPEALFDGNFQTPWVEGAEGSGIGERITILTRRKVTGLSIVNGFALSERLYRRNNRLKTVSISFGAGLTAPGLVSENDYSLFFIRIKEYPETFELMDSAEEQHIPLAKTEALQTDLYSEAVQLFTEDYPDLFGMILDELGISRDDELSSMNLDLIREVYGFYCIRITIEDVYRGTHYDDTCVSEIELALEDF